MREEIKSLALDLLIQRGYRGVSFGDLAKVLKVTRANIHYHFGNKQNLVEEVLDDYIKATSTALQEVWSAPGVPLIRKLETMVEFSRRRYAKYNAPGREGRQWSLMGRLRQDSDTLTPRSHQAMRQFEQDLYASIVAAIEDAKARREFAASMPVEDVALQLVSIANSAGPITQDAGSFGRLEQLYMGFARIITYAYGDGESGRSPRPKPARPKLSAGDPARPSGGRRRPKNDPV